MILSNENSKKAELSDFFLALDSIESVFTKTNI